MLPNGPAIWGGCVTRRKHRAGSWYFSQKAVTVQGGYGTCFCSHGTNFIEHYACRACPVRAQRVTGVQGWSEPRFYPRLQSFGRALAQCRGTNYFEGRNFSRCRILITGRCACPGARTITNLSWEQEQKQKP